MFRSITEPPARLKLNRRRFKKGRKKGEVLLLKSKAELLLTINKCSKKLTLGKF